MEPAYDSHEFLSIGLASCIVLTIASLSLAIYALFRLHQITDQVEQAADKATPPMAESFEKDTIKVPHTYKEINGHRIRISTGEQPVAPELERQVAVRQAGTDAREDVQDLRGRRPSPHPAGAASGTKMRDVPQRGEAPTSPGFQGPPRRADLRPDR